MKIYYTVKKRYNSLAKAYQDIEVSVETGDSVYRLLVDCLRNKHMLSIDEVKERLPFYLPEFGITITKIE